MGINLSEPTIVQDVFLTGVIPEDLGENMRFTGFCQQNSFVAGGIEYVVVSRIIMPKQSIMASIKATMQAMGIACCGGEKMRVLNH
jgi:hypothetical protein